MADDQNDDRDSGRGRSKGGGKSKQDPRPKNPCPACTAERPFGATVCTHCKHGMVTYKLVAIPTEGKESWLVNLTVYRQDPPKPAMGVAARIDIFDKGTKKSQFANITARGRTIVLPFKDKSREVTFSVQFVIEGAQTVNPDVDTRPLPLAAKTIKKKIVEPPTNTSKGFLGNFLTGWNAGKGK